MEEVHMSRVAGFPLIVSAFLMAGFSSMAIGQVVVSRDTLVYFHVPQQQRYYQAGPNETLCVWLSQPRAKPWRLTSVRFTAGDSASWDTVRGCVRLVPRYASGGKSLADLGSLVRTFTFMTGAEGETAVASFSPLPTADTTHDLAVCWTSRRMRRTWPIDDTASWSPPRSYRVWDDSGRIIAPLAGDLAVVGVFTLSETVQMRDVEVSTIVAPLGRLTQGTAVAPRATVRNNGSDTASFPVLFRIGTSYVDSVNVSGLAPGTAALVSFSAWTATPLGMHAVRCSTALHGDVVPTNDLRVDSVVIAPPDTGSFSVKLIWKDGRADLDLYLIFPTQQGTADTVCWNRRQAEGCMLDVDDQEGYGPEVISGPVSLAMPESAKIGVHYFGPADGASTQAKVLFYRNRALVGEKGWYALSPGNWWNVAFANLRTGAPGFPAKRSVLKNVKGLKLK